MEKVTKQKKAWIPRSLQIGNCYPVHFILESWFVFVGGGWGEGLGDNLGEIKILWIIFKNFHSKWK